MIPRLEDLDLDKKTVLLQMSLDVPLHDGTVADDTRLRASIPTIEYLLAKDCRVIICGHVGRPDGPDPELSTKPMADALAELLGRPVFHSQDIEELPTGNPVMLENTRFHPGERKADRELAACLAGIADVFVSDDYPSAHRAYAINTIVPTLLPSCAGKSMLSEYSTINHVLDDPEKPLTVIIGGAKADKIGIVDNMLSVADTIILGGVLANTFLKAAGQDIKGSLYDEKSLEIAGEYLRDAEERFVLPVDAIAAAAFDEDAEHAASALSDIPGGWTIVDIGPGTRKRYADVLEKSHTIIWGGPIGVFEWEWSSHGTAAVAQAIAEADAYSLVAGGDSGDAIRDLGYTQSISHLSIGGGATLALIGGDPLPAIEALRK